MLAFRVLGSMGLAFQGFWGFCEDGHDEEENGIMRKRLSISGIWVLIEIIAKHGQL